MSCANRFAARFWSAVTWPQWRGLNRDAKASGFTAPKNWPKELTQKWKITVGEGVATPSLVGNKLYVFARQQEKEIIQCLAADTAKELWKNADNSFQFNSPLLSNGFVFGLSAGNEFFCINEKDGKTAWKAPLSAPSAEAEPSGGRGGRRGGGSRGGYGSIVDAGSVLLALTPASELVAFEPNAKGYTEVARIKVADSPVYAYPVVSGNRIFVKDQESVILWTIQ